MLAALSRRRSRVQVPSGPPRSRRSATCAAPAEDDDLAGLVVTVLGARAGTAAAVVARVGDPIVPPHDAVYLAGEYADPPTRATLSRSERLDTLTERLPF